MLNNNISSSQTSRVQSAAFVLLVLWCAYCCFFNIQASLSPADETLYAHVTQSVFSDGQWLRPFFDGNPYYAKIPFVNWCAAIFCYIFGEAPWTHRLFSALSGFGIFLLTYALARRMGLSKFGAALAVVTLSGSWVFVFLNGIRRGCLDAPLNLFLIAAVYAAWMRRDDTRRFSRWRILWIVSFACAMFAKSAGGLLVLPLTAVIIAIRPAKPLTFSVVGGFLVDTIIASALPLVYYIPAIARYPDLYTVGIQQEILTRISHNYNRAKGPSFYLSQLVEPWRFFPPLMVVPVFTYAVWRSIRTKESYWPILCIWFTVVVVAFSFVRTRWPWYIDPAIPAGSILFGAVWDDLSSILSKGRDSLPKRRVVFTRVVLGVLIIGAIGGGIHTAVSVWKANKIRILDRTVVDLRDRYGAVAVAQFGYPDFESTEKVSIRMLSMHPSVVNSREELLGLLAERGRVVVIGKRSTLDELNLRDLHKSYTVLPPWRTRNQEVAVVVMERASG